MKNSSQTKKSSKLQNDGLVVFILWGSEGVWRSEEYFANEEFEVVIK